MWPNQQLSAIKAMFAEKCAAPPEALDEQWIWLLDDVSVTTRDYVNVINHKKGVSDGGEKWQHGTWWRDLALEYILGEGAPGERA